MEGQRLAEATTRDRASSRSRLESGFSAEEAVQIRQAILTPGAMPTCPRCGTLLRLLRSHEEDRTLAALQCESCHRRVSVPALAEYAPTDPI
jgi:hypothetical protein